MKFQSIILTTWTSSKTVPTPLASRYVCFDKISCKGALVVSHWWGGTIGQRLLGIVSASWPNRGSYSRALNIRWPGWPFQNEVNPKHHTTFFGRLQNLQDWWFSAKKILLWTILIPRSRLRGLRLASNDHRQIAALTSRPYDWKSNPSLSSDRFSSSTLQCLQRIKLLALCRRRFHTSNCSGGETLQLLSSFTTPV